MTIRFTDSDESRYEALGEEDPSFETANGTKRPLVLLAMVVFLALIAWFASMAMTKMG